MDQIKTSRWKHPGKIEVSENGRWAPALLTILRLGYKYVKTLHRVC